MRVWVQPVQRAQAGEVEIAEDVLGEQRGTEQQGEVRGEDRHPQRAPGQRADGEQDCRVARGHDQDERLEAVRAETDVETGEGTSQPARPASAAGGDILRGRARGPRGEQQDGREHAEQAERAEPAQAALRG